MHQSSTRKLAKYLEVRLEKCIFAAIIRPEKCKSVLEFKRSIKATIVTISPDFLEVLEENAKTIKGMKLLIPSSNIISDFSKNLKPLFDKISELQDESRRLAELRDALLPKLMSGELKVENVTF